MRLTVASGANLHKTFNYSGQRYTMTGAGAPNDHGASASTNTVSSSASEVSGSQEPYAPVKFSAATEMILKRLRGEGGPLNASAALGLGSGAAAGAVQPPGYEDVRRSVLQGMKTTFHTESPAPAPTPTRAAPKAVVARTTTPTSLAASASATIGITGSKSTASGSSATKGRAPRGGKTKAGTKRKRAKDDSDSAEESAAMSDVGGDSDSEGEGDVTQLPTKTLSGRQVVKPAQFNPAASDGPPRKRSTNHKRTGRSVDQALCKRCGRGHSPQSNMIVFCDGCNGGWHQMCHDPMVADELVRDESKPWFCNSCAAKRAPKKSAAPPVQSAVPEPSRDAGWGVKSLEEV